MKKQKISCNHGMRPSLTVTDSFNIEAPLEISGIAIKVYVPR